tara:strand:- start:57 stop:461 length:405 start_codon:yes stop_codon:yes gene_type:complete
MKVNQNPVFVLAWVTLESDRSKELGNGGKVVFVEHPERGWEIPGGHLEDGENPEQALLRELKEETGLDGRITHWNKDYYPNGWVAHVITQTSEPKEWTVNDDKVRSVKWWDEIPPLIEWTREEFSDLTEWCSNL